MRGGKFLKRILSILVSLAVVTSIVPVTVIAEAAGGGPSEPTPQEGVTSIVPETSGAQKGVEVTDEASSSQEPSVEASAQNSPPGQGGQVEPNALPSADQAANSAEVTNSSAHCDGRGDCAGAKGASFRMVAPSTHYFVNRQTYGWETAWFKSGGQESEMTGRSKSLEGIRIVSVSRGAKAAGATFKGATKWVSSR